MNRIYPAIVCAFLLTNCFSPKQQEQTDTGKKNSTPSKITNNKGTTLSQKETETPKEKEEEKKKEKETKSLSKASPVQALLARLGKGAKIEYEELNRAIERNDTTVHTKHGDYQISYATACLNDSLVAMEMYNYEAGYSKSYRLVHNFQTSINMNHNGKPSGSRVISKDIFKGKMQPDFLEKAIIKHPQFVRFDEEKNEAIFQFLVGVPATDYVVLAGINLSPRGEIRIIDVTMPRF